ncbi:MAG: peptidoglycan-associated lipoprotein Pal [Thermodesulfobacteriota bacterium]
MSVKKTRFLVFVVAVIALCFAASCGVKPQAGSKAQECGAPPAQDQGMAVSASSEAGAAASAAASEEDAQYRAMQARQAEFRAEKETFTTTLVHFDYDKSDIRPADAKILDAKADFLTKYPDVKILIAGNCDERGTIEYNLALGERRAQSAKNYLVNKGIAAERIQTISYGKERPLDPAHTEAAWAENRRDDFNVQ